MRSAVSPASITPIPCTRSVCGLIDSGRDAARFKPWDNGAPAPPSSADIRLFITSRRLSNETRILLGGREKERGSERGGENQPRNHQRKKKKTQPHQSFWLACNDIITSWPRVNSLIRGDEEIIKGAFRATSNHLRSAQTQLSPPSRKLSPHDFRKMDDFFFFKFWINLQAFHFFWIFSAHHLRFCFVLTGC